MITRTNNEVEGNHYGLMCRLRKSNNPFYSLVQSLFREAEYIKYQILRLFKDEKLSNKNALQRKRDFFLSNLWYKLDIKYLTAPEFLDIWAQKVDVNETWVLENSRVELDDDED